MVLSSSKNGGRKKQVIFIGLHEIANIGATYAKAFQALGYETYSVAREKNHYFTHEEYNVVISEKLKHFRGNYPLAGLIYFVLQELLVGIEFIKALFRCDIFVFIYGSSFFLETYLDYPILKLAGKKIVSVFCGCDVRHWSAYNQEFESLGLDVQFKSVCKECNQRSACYLTQKLKTVQVAEKYSDLILSHHSLSQLLAKPYMRAYNPVVLSEYRFNVPARDIPVVVHAPTNRSIKGTAQVLAAVERLREEGIRFDFKLIEDTNNSRMREILTDSDIVVDSVSGCAIGLLSLESMATGNAVLSGYLTGSDVLSVSCPVVNVNPSNIYDELRRLILDKNHRVTLAYAGRQYVETYHDHIAIARQILGWLESDGIQNYDYYPDFATKHYKMPRDILRKEKASLPRYLLGRIFKR